MTASLHENEVPLVTRNRVGERVPTPEYSELRDEATEKGSAYLEAFYWQFQRQTGFES